MKPETKLTPFQDAFNLIMAEEDMKYAVVKGLLSSMNYHDVKLITDYCINLERSLSQK